MNELETLTEEERRQVEVALSVLSKDSGAYPALAKLLRIHDQQAEHPAELNAELYEARRLYAKFSDLYGKNETALGAAHARIVELEAKSGQLTRDLLQRGAQVRELEAKETTRHAARLVELASGTVSRVEYDRMVEQRDTLREDLKAARFRIVDLGERVAELEQDQAEREPEPAFPPPEGRAGFMIEETLRTELLAEAVRKQRPEVPADASLHFWVESDGRRWDIGPPGYEVCVEFNAEWVGPPSKPVD